jgi:acyl-CoA reductase-like NAD-dependent aldehyde dehydrogenase
MSATPLHRTCKPPEPWLLVLLAGAVRDQRADWQAECAAVKAAFESWSLAPPESRAQVYIAYMIALEQEEQAARIYRDLLREAGAPGVAERSGESTQPEPASPRTRCPSSPQP